MKTATRMASAFLLGLLTSPVFTMATLAQSQPLPCSTCSYRGAPGPIIGAGLPVLAIGFGYGIYWLVKRRSKTG
jgi:hypothetical protein